MAKTFAGSFETPFDLSLWQGQNSATLTRAVRASKMETLNTKPISSRLRQRISEPAMLDLTQRLIAIPSENPPGNQSKSVLAFLPTNWTESASLR